MNQAILKERQHAGFLLMGWFKKLHWDTALVSEEKDVIVLYLQSPLVVVLCPGDRRRVEAGENQIFCSAAHPLPFCCFLLLISYVP